MKGEKMYIKEKYLLSDKNYSNMIVKDGLFYFIDKDNNSIQIYNKQNKNNTIQLNNAYDIFTYNNTEFFYIMSLNGEKKFNKLNGNFDEFDYLSIKSNIKRKINDIYYDKTSNKYYIVDNLLMYSVNTDGEFIKSDIIPSEFYTVKSTNSCKSETTIFPNDFSFTAVGADDNYNYVAYKKNNSSFVAKLAKNGSIIDTLYIGDNKTVNSIGINNGLYLSVNDGQNYLYKIETNSSNTKKNEILDKIIKLLDDVSISEISIANLITSEANKVNKVLEISSDVDKILEVNYTVTDVIKKTENLENIQQQNLNIILESIKELEKYLNN
jgi:hypothetical protein